MEKFVVPLFFAIVSDSAPVLVFLVLVFFVLVCCGIVDQ
jgi:hypothetical protein